MTPQQWARLKEIFQGALDQPAATRRKWVSAAAAGDADLQGEAEALLHAHDTAEGFLDESIAVSPADLFPADGVSAELADLFPPGARLGPYVVEREIGRGGMGVVYLAEDTRLGRRVAIKSLPPQVASDQRLRERLRREARAAATIAHPSIAIVYALEEIDDHVLLVTEYVAGRTLRTELGHGALPSARALAITGDIAQALAAAHDAGVVHRDLKPENIMLTPSDGVKVLDFGIAHIDDPGAARLTLEGALLGTPAYMSPEQLAGGPVDGRADIHAAGTILFEMITGRHPAAPGGHTATIPVAISTVIERSLQQNPAARYASARELFRAIEGAKAHPEARTETAPAPTAARWWWEFHQAMTALLYWLMVIPVWNARSASSGWPGRAAFILALASVIVAANLRLHLWFTSRFYPGELKWLRARVAPWIHAADWLFAITLIAAGLLIGNEGSPLAILLMSFGLGAGVGFLFIEPATTRAAFRKSA